MERRARGRGWGRSVPALVPVPLRAAHTPADLPDLGPLGLRTVAEALHCYVSRQAQYDNVVNVGVFVNMVTIVYTGICQVKFFIPLINCTLKDRMMKFGVWTILTSFLKSSNWFFEMLSFSKVSSSILLEKQLKLKFIVQFAWKIN